MTTTITIEPAKAGNSLTDSCDAGLVSALTVPESAWQDASLRKQVMADQHVLDPSYVFDPDMTGEVIECLFDGRHGLLTGAPGAGKTSCVEQVCLRLGIPVFQFGCSAESTAEQFVGFNDLTNGTTSWQSGPLCQACETASAIGGNYPTKAVLLLDELDASSSSVMVGLNRFLDCGLITAGGKVWHGDGVTVFATANTSGAGDESGNWQSRQPIDPAILNRMVNIPVDYMSAEAEAQVFARMWGPMGGHPDDSTDTFAMMLAKALADVRESWYNGELHQQPISTRQACGIVRRWSHTDGSTWWKAVRGCCLGSTRGSSRDALSDYHVIMEAFGGVWPDSMAIVRDGFHKEGDRVNDLLNK